MNVWKQHMLLNIIRTVQESEVNQAEMQIVNADGAKRPSNAEM